MARTRRIRTSVEGTKEVKEVLNSLGDAAADILQEAADDGAKVVLKDAIRRAPVSKYGKQGGKHPHPPGNLKSEIKLTRSKMKNANRKAASRVGFGRSAFYGVFVELGTRKMKARPFLRPATDENHRSIAKAVNAAISRALKRVK